MSLHKLSQMMVDKKEEEKSFDLQKYLCSKDGDEWLKEVKVEDSNKKSFRYYAPPVAWEDINRHNNSAFGDFIFDVTIRIKDNDNNNNQNKNIKSNSRSNTIRYVLRPQNMTDPISLQSTKSINIPIGNYNGDKLKNVKLIDLLSKDNLLKDIGLNCKLSGSLYEPLIDEPAHCLPDIQCICGESMQRITATTAYPLSYPQRGNGLTVHCDVCNDKKPIKGIVYHCPKDKKHEMHPNGYDICEQCVGLQIRTFIETKDSKNQQSSNNEQKNNENNNKSKQDKYGKGGMMFSVGCGLMSEHDMGHSYEIEVYLHQSHKYRDGKCLCIITTSEGSTANIIEMGEIEILKFAKNKKECDWGIDKFDTSTEEGRINERTGKSAETDMIIYFIPVQEDKPKQSHHYGGWRGGYRGRGRGGGCIGATPLIGSIQPYSHSYIGSHAVPPMLSMVPQNNFSNNNNSNYPGSQSHCASSVSSSLHHRCDMDRDIDRDRSRSRSRERNKKKRKRKRSNTESDSDHDDENQQLQLKFAKHKMSVSDRDFNVHGMKLKHPLKRIRELPIRSFLRGAVFFDQTKKPDLNDGKRLSNYLQSRYNDTELLSIHSYSVLIKQRAKLLPISDEYYKNLNKFRNEKEEKNSDGIYDLYFTQNAKKNDETCVVCMDESISSVMVDCYHMCLCTQCGLEWTMSCPICRTKITKIVKENELDKSKIRIIPMAVSD